MTDLNYIQKFLLFEGPSVPVWHVKARAQAFRQEKPGLQPSQAIVMAWAGPSLTQLRAFEPGQNITSSADGNLGQLMTIAQSIEGTANPTSNSIIEVSGDLKRPVDSPLIVYHQLRIAELFKELKGLVKSYYQGQIKKHRAVVNILVALSHCPRATPANKDLTYDHWTQEMDCIKQILADALAKETAFDMAAPVDSQSITLLKSQRESSENRESLMEDWREMNNSEMERSDVEINMGRSTTQSCLGTVKSSLPKTWRTLLLPKIIDFSASMEKISPVSNNMSCSQLPL